MSSIASNAQSFNPAVQPNRLDASQFNENPTDQLNQSMDEKKNKEKEKEKKDPELKFKEILMGPDGALYEREDDEVVLILPAPTSQDQITY